MFTVKTYIDRSPIEGVGVFAAEAIAKGQMVTRHIDGFDMVFTQREFAAKPKIMQDFIKRQGYQSEGVWILNGDHERFTNHADKPNTTYRALPEEGTFATRDIAKGEEITCDYREFSDDWQEKLYGDMPLKAVRR